MKSSEIWLLLKRFLRRVVLVDLFIIIAIIIAGLALRWQSIAQYSNALNWIGIALFILGCLTAIGGMSSRGHDIASYSISGAGKMTEHLQRSVMALDGQMGFLFLMSASAGILIGMSYLLQAFG